MTGFHKDRYYPRLVEIAEILETPTEVMRILYCVKQPYGEQGEFVATTLAQLAIDRHFEL
ncbi:hypothetical protein Pan241w_58880 [Gimesia alba]|uniref:Uncharacterized protein n=1 Tax=Gimesia alba TaxID=2527973 RepID=A0A517RPE9_9PLAN|nr:hypothetical protein Pan241w_58880 [Gimesia alba]